jgi:chromosome segregation ATPase
MAIKYEKEFVKPDGRRLPTGGPRDLQRRQRQESREQTELIDFLRVEIRDLNERLAVKTVGTGEYTGDQVDEEIRKAVSSAVEEVKVSTKEEMVELRSAADALKNNENKLLEQIKNLEIYQFGVKDSTDKLKSNKKELEDELKDARLSVGGLTEQLKVNKTKRTDAEKEVKSLNAEIEKLKDGAEAKYFELEATLIEVEHKRVLLENDKINSGVNELKSDLEESQKQRANLQTQLGDMAQKLKNQTVSTESEEKLKAEKDSLNVLHNKDMKKFQSEIEFLIKEKTDLTNKHNNEITKFKIESEKKKGEYKSLKEKAKQKGVDEEITTLLKEQTKQIEALTEALANAEQQLEIETNRPKMETAFIDPLEKGAGADLTPHIEVKEEKSGGEKGEIDDKVARLRSLMGKLPKANG